MMKSRVFVFLCFSLIVSGFYFQACRSNSSLLSKRIHHNKISLEKANQRTGDVTKGKEYLLKGDFIDSGFPTEYDAQSAVNSDSGFSPFTSIESPDGIQMIAPNCLQCHADSLLGQYVIGLPNTSFDFTVDMTYASQFIKRSLISTHGKQSATWQAAMPFVRAMEAVSPYIQTEVVGANPADKLAAVLAAHRNPEDLSWTDSLLLDIPLDVVPADPPAWWLLKYKHAMFATGIGRGDFARLMMASSLLTLVDTSRASEIDHHFRDVQAYIESLKAPVYPFEVDEVLVQQGELLFKKNCAKCHGTQDAYPNYLVDIETVKTDSLLVSSNFAFPAFINWYNNSWFSKGAGRAWLEKDHGYVAPPLEGVWATAPYFHNGSVPTVYHVLNSKLRPSYWTKHHSSFAIDRTNLGWQYREFTHKIDKYCYDTTLPGYGNQGHPFGDALSDDERYAIIEYLKTY